MKSPDFNDVYFVGVQFTVTGVDDTNEGVWAVNGGLDGTGRLLAVEGFAQEFYDGPDADVEGIDVTDPSVDKAKDCL